MLAHKINILWVSTHLQSLNFCSYSSKAKPEAMQEIWDNTSVDPCSNLPNESMWPYLIVPTYLMELFVEFFTLSWVVKRWNLSSMSLLLNLFLKSIRENMIKMILLFLNFRHSDTLFFVCGSSPWYNKCSFSSYPLKAKYVELMGKAKGYNSSHIYCQAKWWSKNT
jgi:hypothetical protein